MENRCALCVFCSEDDSICDFGEGIIRKPQGVIDDEDFCVNRCSLGLNKIYYDKTLDEDRRKELIESRREVASRYYIDK